MSQPNRSRQNQTPTQTRRAAAATQHRPARPGVAVALATALSLGLIGCGGGGESATPQSNSAGRAQALALSKPSPIIDGKPADDGGAIHAVNRRVVATGLLVGHDAARGFEHLLRSVDRVHALLALHPHSQGETTSKDGATPDSPTPEIVTITQSLDCPGGGSASVDITGTRLGVLNGAPDKNEVYALHLDHCAALETSGQLSGSFTLSYTEVSGSTDAGTGTTQINAADWVASGLTLNLTGSDGRSASLWMDGQGQFQRSTSLATDGSQSQTLQLLANPLNLSLSTGKGSVSTTLSDVNLSLSSSSNAAGNSSGSDFSGTFSMSLPSVGVSVTVATGGTVHYDESGNPESGQWTLDTGNLGLDVSVDAAGATVSIDQGNNGSTDRSIVLSLNRLRALMNGL